MPSCDNSSGECSSGSAIVKRTSRLSLFKKADSYVPTVWWMNPKTTYTFTKCTRAFVLYPSAKRVILILNICLFRFGVILSKTKNRVKKNIYHKNFRLCTDRTFVKQSPNVGNCNPIKWIGKEIAQTFYSQLQILYIIHQIINWNLPSQSIFRLVYIYIWQRPLTASPVYTWHYNPNSLMWHSEGMPTGLHKEFYIFFTKHINNTYIKLYN